MGKVAKFNKVIITSILLFVISNSVASAHEDDNKNITENKTETDNQLLTNKKQNSIRREQQRDKMYSLFTKVISTQDPEDQYLLGKMFQFGNGVEKDDIQAYVWTALSLTNGYPGATKTLRDLESHMSTYEVSYAIDLLRKIRELR